MQKTLEQYIACNCATANTMAIIGGKWKILILDHLRDHPQGFNELQRSLIGITAHTLSKALKEMVEDNLISRYDFHTNPPKTEYSITTKGKELFPMLDVIQFFGKKYPINKNRNT